MQIDITKLLSNQIAKINIDDVVNIPNTMLKNTRIDDLKNIAIKGIISLDEDNELIVNATVNGIMVLKDDLTLEPVEYTFTADVEENISSYQNIIDITEIVWQNILTEIPSKVRSTDEEVYLSGDGWRVISEDKYQEERNPANNPFANLEELLKTKEDK